MLKLQIHLEKLLEMQKKYYFWHENSYWTYHIALPAEKLLLKRQTERHKRGNEQLNLWGLSCNLSCGHHQTVDSKTILTLMIVFYIQQNDYAREETLCAKVET